MRYIAEFYRRLILRLDQLAEDEPKEKKKVATAQKYIIASVFPDQKTMDIALGTINESPK